jgi:resolvase-like protein
MNPRATRRFVAYYRVSTDRQGRSGLGLEAQRKAVMDFLNGGAWELVGEFVEVESGKKSDRPELTRAIDTYPSTKPGWLSLNSIDFHEISPSWRPLWTPASNS